MVTKRLPIGIDKIADVMSDNYYFVDKTGFLRRVIDNVGKGSALLITRPRRFGKTLTLDMVRAFFDCRASEEERGYFANLQIAQAGERYLVGAEFRSLWMRPG